MMQPEHKVEINLWANEVKKRERIDLDEQEWEEVSRAVAQSMQQREPIKIRIYHEIEELEIIGIVDRIDKMNGRFMVDDEWFPIRNIEGASIEH